MTALLLYKDSRVGTAQQGFKEVDVADKGAWRRLADNTSLWSFSILSQDASSHVIVFRLGCNSILNSCPWQNPSHRGLDPSLLCGAVI
jgi:hypothetical protein